ncbi:MAG: sugar phosphate isomerase/epimerase family protein [Planctomycetia bacterium]|nr:sugar phosphate isomerase/epimerase family protein [Planctomycetia bacterium]
MNEKMKSCSRRDFFRTAAFSTVALGTSSLLADENLTAAAPLAREARKRLALNLAVLLPLKIPFLEQLQLVAQAGFRNVEIWFRFLDEYLQEGGTLAELKAFLNDLDLRVVGAIGFAPWGVNDPDVRRRALDTMKVDMERMAALGAETFAAAPSGIHNRTDVELPALAERYRSVLEAGEQFGVFPQLEIWGVGTTLSKLSDALWVVSEAAHPRATLLLDVYHLFRGGNDFVSLMQTNPRLMSNFHWNDYPGDIPREALKDGDRVFPGDGVAPLGEIRRTLEQNGFRGTYSLEIFNQGYCQKYEPGELMRISFEKMAKSIFSEYNPEPAGGFAP